MARVLVFGAWDDGPGYPRARTLLQALEATGHEITVWRLPSVFAGRRRIDVVRRPWRWPGALVRLAGSRRHAHAQFRSACAVVRPDAVVVPYPGHCLVPLLRRCFAGPILLDLFLSAHDTVVEDRAFFRQGSLAARLLQWLDRRACRAADLTVLDTPAHAERVAGACGIPASRFGWLPIGDPDAPVQPAPYVAPVGPLRLLFFGTGVPLHGLPVLVDAVCNGHADVVLDVIGGSPQERAAIAARASPRVRLGPAFVDRATLQRAIDAAHVVCGVFGSSGKTDRVVPFKVVHALAAGRPVLTGDTTAVRAWLSPDQDVLLARRGDPAALAQRLAAIAADRAHLPAIAAAGRAAYDRVFAPAALARQASELLRRVLRPTSQDVEVSAHA